MAWCDDMSDPALDGIIEQPERVNVGDYHGPSDYDPVTGHAKPWEPVRREPAEEEEPLALWLLDKVTWGCSGPYADTTTMPWELETWLLANPD